MTRATLATPPANGELEALLEYLKERRNFDFRGYKRASLSRRIFKRMQTINVEDYQRYIEVLEANPGEFGEHGIRRGSVFASCPVRRCTGRGPFPPAGQNLRDRC